MLLASITLNMNAMEIKIKNYQMKIILMKEK